MVSNIMIRSYSKTIVLISWLVVALCVAGLWGYYTFLQATVIPNTEKQLFDKALTKIAKVEEYVKHQQIRLNTLLTNEKVINFLKDEKNTSDEAFALFARGYLESNDFKNLLVIAKNGNIIFSEKEPQAFKVNLNTSPLDTTNLGKAFIQTVLSLTPTISDFSHDFILKKPSLYMIAPMFHQRILYGFIAVEMDYVSIYEIIQDYFDLGTTGDVIVSSLTGNSIKLLTPTRNDPHAAFTFFENISATEKTLSERAILGDVGSGSGLDYRGILSVGGWGYLPNLAWGIVVKKNMSEVAASTRLIGLLLYGTLFLLFVITVITTIVFRNIFKTWVVFLFTLHLRNFLRMRSLAVCGLVLSLFGAGILIHRYYALDRQATDQAHTLAKERLKYALDEISLGIDKIMMKTQAIADDLSSGRLKKDDLLIRMERDLRENSFLAGITIAYEPYTYSADRKLFAPHMTQQGEEFKTEYIDTQYDYTQKNAEIFEEAWYEKPLKLGALWFKPIRENVFNRIVAWYGTPFYAVDDDKKTKPIGVVVTEYDIGLMANIAQKLIVGETGYAFIVLEDGAFIYHPNKTIVEEKKTLFDVARQIVSPELREAANKITQSKSGLQKYTAAATKEPVWIHFDTIPQVGWKLGIVFSEDEISVDRNTLRHLQIWILIYFVIATILLFFIILRISVDNVKKMRFFAVIMSIVFIVALFIMFLIIWQTNSSTQMSDVVVVQNETNLKAFLSEKEQRAALRYQQLRFVPTGIMLYAISFPDTEHVTFTAYIWQKYDAQDTTIPRELLFPESTELSIQKVFEKTVGAIQTVGWNVTATLRQYYDHTKYPFDQRIVSIPLMPALSVSGNVLYTPALSDYQNMTEIHTIGIDPELHLSDFTIDKAYFSFVTEMQESTLGVDEHTNINNLTHLQYNIVLSRGLLNAFIMYIVPIFVILFSLYAIFVKTAGLAIDPVDVASSLIAPYTGLLFALIILHGALRSNYRVGGFLYIESLFFLAYITLLIFILHALFSRRSDIQNFMDNITLLLRIFFWPIQFACWFIATIIVFYN